MEPFFQQNRPKTKSVTLWCFSPPVMLATFLLEFTLGIYILVKGKHTYSTSLIVAILFCLGVFQIAEFQVCGGDRGLLWMRIGYAAIALLPPLGINLVTLVTGHRWIKWSGYALAAVFLTYFLIDTGSINAAVCGGNYILIHTSGILSAHLFPFYYNLAITIGLLDIIYFMVVRSGEVKRSKDQKNLLWWLIGGYAAFLVPTGAIYFLSPASAAGLPSIMCGFAVFLAIILVWKVYPACRKVGI